jgi:signal transduction histidine kinase
MGNVSLLLYLPIVALAAISVLLYRAAPKRFDNRALAATCALTVPPLTLNVLAFQGAIRLHHPTWVAVNLAMTIPLVYAVTLFAASFPFDRRLRAREWSLLSLLPAAALVWVLVYPVSTTWIWGVYFGLHAPYFALVAYWLVRSYRRVTQPRVAAGMRLVMAGILLPWAVGLVMIPIGAVLGMPVAPNPWVAAIRFGTQLLGALVVARAALSYHFLGTRSVLSELALWLLGASVTLGVTVLGAGALGAPSGYTLVVMGSVAVTALVFGLVSELRPRWEHRLAVRPGHEIVDHALAEARRLTEPADLAERALRVLEALFPRATVVLHRATGAPPWMLPGAAGVDDALAREAAARGLLAMQHADALPEAVAAALRAARADLLVPLQAGDRVLGVVRVSGGAPERWAITEARRLADLLAQKLAVHGMYTELEQARQLAALGAFAAGFAHEVRTPLSSIRMNMQILRRKASLTESDREYLDIALVEIDRLAREVSEALDFARPLLLRSRSCPVRAVLEEAARKVQAAVVERGIRLEVRADDDLPVLYADPERLGQILVNLVINAAHASAPGGRVELDARAVDGAVELCVRDEGAGIPAEDLPKIFEPFFTTRRAGTGLGLPIARRIAEAHGGLLVAESAVGKGSEFRLRLPVQPAPVPAIDAEGAERAAAS